MTTRIGPYVLGEEIERRALTLTYRARHARIQRDVRIKTLKPTVAVTSSYAIEIEREAQILGRLRHEGILAVYDLLRTDSRIWLVLEDPPGFTLAELVAKLPPPRRLPPEVVIAIGVLICDALAHAHEHGVVHRELQPECIWLAEDGKIKLAEFSGAHDEQVVSSPVPFEAAETLARPDYKSPEQILGDDATAESDVYAVAAILYALVAGHPPFSGDGDKDIAQRIRHDAPRSLREVVGSSVPPSLDALVLRALAKRPEERFDSAEPLRRALASLLPDPRQLHAIAARALAVAGIAGEWVEPEPEVEVQIRPVTGVGAAIGRLAAVFVGIVLGGAVVQWATADEDEPVGLGAKQGTGWVRVLARPWAEVFVDGERVDVTPIGIPLPVSAGRHYVTFRHPQAPDEQRTIKVEVGQTIVVDVIMRIERDAGVPDAGADDPDASP